MRLQSPDTIYLGRGSVLSDSGAGLSVDGVKPGKQPSPGYPDIADTPPPRQSAPVVTAPEPWPTANEPPPKTAPIPAGDDDASAAAIADANAGNPYKLVSTLVQLREDTKGAFEDAKGALTGLGTMAAAIANALEISEADARLLVDAMSRGGLDARLIADGVNALRGMNVSDRAQWGEAWLPTAIAGAHALIELADNPTMKSLGATDSIVARLGQLSELSFFMVNRNVSTFPNGDTVQKRAEAVRARLEYRLGKPQGADAILGEIASIDAAFDAAAKKQREADAVVAPPPRQGGNWNRGDRPDILDDLPTTPAKSALVDEAAAATKAAEAKRMAFAADIASRYGVPLAMALAVIDAMRKSSRVANMIADGLSKLEALDQAKGAFAATFFQTAVAAADAASAMQADPLAAALGVMTEEEAAPVGNLASCIAAMAEYKKLLDRQARAAKT